MALPSDVRKGSGLPVERMTDWGYALLGHSPQETFWLFGGAEPHSTSGGEAVSCDSWIEFGEEIKTIHENTNTSN